MNHAGDASEQIIRFSFEGLDFVIRLVGSGAKNIAAGILAGLKNVKNKEQVLGKASIKKMLRSEKPTKYFSITKDDMKRFAKAAKRYGLLYTVCAKEGSDGKSPVTLMAKEEDAQRVSMILEKLKIGTVEMATAECKITEVNKDTSMRSKQEVDEMIDKMLNEKSKSKIVFDEQPDQAQNPTKAETGKEATAGKDGQFEPTYKTQPESAGGTPYTKKPASVKEFLNVRKLVKAAERDAQKQPDRIAPALEQIKPNNHKQPKIKSKSRKKAKTK